MMFLSYYSLAHTPSMAPQLPGGWSQTLHLARKTASLEPAHLSRPASFLPNICSLPQLASHPLAFAWAMSPSHVSSPLLNHHLQPCPSSASDMGLCNLAGLWTPAFWLASLKAGSTGRT